jgi:hypothetical protein
MDGHAANGSQTGTIIGIFPASGNAGREGERLLALLWQIFRVHGIPKSLFL